MVKHFLVISFLFLLSSCATWSSGVRLVDIDKPLAHIKHAVLSSVPLGVQRTEDAGMVVYSKYFRPGKKKFIPSHSYRIRYYAQILIRGDRRPYTVEIHVHKEERDDSSEQRVSSYIQVGQDERLGKLIRQRIKEQLSKRRDGSDIIDDFRVF